MMDQERRGREMMRPRFKFTHRTRRAEKALAARKGKGVIFYFGRARAYIKIQLM